MLRINLLILLICLIQLSNAQKPKKVNTGRFSGIRHEALLKSTNKEDIFHTSWDIIMQSLPNEEAENVFHLKELKQIKNVIKAKQSTPSFSSAKTASAAPSVGVSFNGNPLKSWTPTDNSIAISDSGIIVSCINEGLAYYDSAGNTIMAGQTWTAFINDSTLTSAKFDPRVIFDKKHQRFIIALLHGFSSTKSKILTCFSKTSNPMDGWYIYQLSGNPFNDTAWSDYPTIGISDQELFINGNQFSDAPNYDWKGTFIYQVGLAEGYAGLTLNTGVWDSIYTSDNLDGITLYPASNGLGASLSEKMYFVQLMPDSGSNVYLYQLDGLLASPSKTLTCTQYAIPHFEVCGNAYQKDPNSGFVDSLSTGSAWTQNAFSIGNTVHFTFDADVAGWCGIHYGRIYLDSNKAVVSSYSEIGTDLCYPAVASLGIDSLDKSVGIAYLKSDSVLALMPEVDALAIDNNLSWSSSLIIKKGDTSVNILYPPTYAIQPERWGDYTGICRKYVNGTPQVWLAGAYGANTPPRNNSYGTWIAQLFSNFGSASNLPNIPISENDGLLYPNPTTTSFTLEFENKKAGMVSIDLYDASGRLVKHLFDDYLNASRNKLSFNQDVLSVGSYFIVCSRDKKKVFSKKMFVQ